MVNRGLNRADRRALMGTTGIQPATDLLMARVGVWVYVGVHNGGRVRLTLEQARQAAGSLLEISDDEEERPDDAG